MLRIGEFSRLSRIAVKTLRYYDEIGLLRPDFVDARNGYRYYAYRKLYTVSRIQRLKQAGLRLEEIAEALQRHGDTAFALSLLHQRREELVEEKQSILATMDALETMISDLQKEHTMEKVILSSLPEVIVASMRTKIDSYDSLFSVVPPMGDVMRKQGAVCREPAYCFNIFHDGEYRETDIDVEICEAVTEARADGDGVVYKSIAAVDTAATLLHIGPYATLGESYARLFAWIEQHGYVQSGAPREAYIDGIWNRHDPALWRTRIEVPVVKKV